MGKSGPRARKRRPVGYPQLAGVVVAVAGMGCVTSCGGNDGDYVRGPDGTFLPVEADDPEFGELSTLELLGLGGATGDAEFGGAGGLGGADGFGGADGSDDPAAEGQ